MAQRTILIQSKAHLCIKNGLLMVTLDDRSATIPLEDIWVVVIESHLVTLTVACMSQLNDAGIGFMMKTCVSKQACRRSISGLPPV